MVVPYCRLFDFGCKVMSFRLEKQMFFFFDIVSECFNVSFFFGCCLNDSRAKTIGSGGVVVHFVCEVVL